MREAPCHISHAVLAREKRTCAGRQSRGVELDLQSPDAAWREIGVRAHGPPMATEGQRRYDTAMVVAQLAHHVAPQRAIHRESVKQDDYGAAAARVLVLNS